MKISILKVWSLSSAQVKIKNFKPLSTWVICLVHRATSLRRCLRRFSPGRPGETQPPFELPCAEGGLPDASLCEQAGLATIAIFPFYSWVTTLQSTMNAKLNLQRFGSFESEPIKIMPHNLNVSFKSAIPFHVKDLDIKGRRLAFVGRPVGRVDHSVVVSWDESTLGSADSRLQRSSWPYSTLRLLMRCRLFSSHGWTRLDAGIWSWGRGRRGRGVPRGVPCLRLTRSTQ